jgi:hypothetical protein
MVYILAVFERETERAFKIVFFIPFMEICHENLSAMSEQQNFPPFFIMGKWKFLKSIYVYLGYRAMKGGRGEKH